MSQNNQTGTDVMILKIFSPKNSAKIAFLTENTAKFCKILIITFVFEKNANFFRKLSKIEENCDHNIGPWWVVTVLLLVFIMPVPSYSDYPALHLVSISSVSR
jgi:hypothetical protein